MGGRASSYQTETGPAWNRWKRETTPKSISDSDVVPDSVAMKRSTMGTMARKILSTRPEAEGEDNIEQDGHDGQQYDWQPALSTSTRHGGLRTKKPRQQGRNATAEQPTWHDGLQQLANDGRRHNLAEHRDCRELGHLNDGLQRRKRMRGGSGQSARGVTLVARRE